MTKKKRSLKTLGFLTAVIIGTLFLIMACSGRSGQVSENTGSKTIVRENLAAEGSYPFKPSLVFNWQKTVLDLRSISKFITDNNIKFATFEAGNGDLYITQVKDGLGIEFFPCAKIDGTTIDPIDGLDQCISLQKGNAVVGFEHELILYTIGSPYCVARTVGGYIIEFDVRTGGPCVR